MAKYNWFVRCHGRGGMQRKLPARDRERAMYWSNALTKIARRNRWQMQYGDQRENFLAGMERANGE